MFLLRILKYLLIGHYKTGYSIKGFWGEIKHYNKDGVQIGYTVKNFFGVRKRYDMNGNLVCYTLKNFWGGYNTYDAQGKLIRQSRKTLFGGFLTFDKNGKKVGESYKNFWDGYDHYEVDPYETDCYEVKEVPKAPAKAPKQESSKPASDFVKEPKKTEKTEPKSVVNPDQQKRDYEKYVAYQGKKSDQTHVCYETIEECLKDAKSIPQYARILAFRYENLTEFPAITYIEGTVIKVIPLLRQSKEFEIPLTDIHEAKFTEVTDLAMSALDDEFISLGNAEFVHEFESLFPDYQFGADGIYRTQWELPSGLILTEKSFLELKKLTNK